MVQQHWIMIEAGDDPGYAFGTNRLSHVAGACHLIRQLGTSWAPAAARAHGAEVAAATTGRTLLLTDDEATGRSVVTRVSAQVLSDAPGLEVTGVTGPRFGAPASGPDGPARADALARTRDRLAAARAARPPLVLRDQLLPWSEVCGESGLPACGPDPRPGGGHLAASVLAKSAAWPKARDWMRSLLPGYPEVVPAQADDLRRDEWFALIRARANGTYGGYGDDGASGAYGSGRILADLGALGALEQAAGKALGLAVGASVRARPGADGAILPVMVAANEVIIACRADRAVELARAFLLALEEQARGLTGVSGGPVTGSAGIVFVRSHYPLCAAHALAGELATAAAVAAGRAAHPGSAIDVHVLAEPVLADLRTLRERRAAQGQPPGGPFGVGEPGTHGATWPGRRGGTTVPAPGRRGGTRASAAGRSADAGAAEAWRLSARAAIADRGAAQAAGPLRRGHAGTAGGLPERFPLWVCMLSDWIAGAGEGLGGEVDLAVRRDSDGLPFIPAKTLTGVWRDACERVIAALGAPDDGQVVAWQRWADWIFGSRPGADTDPVKVIGASLPPAALAVSPARFPDQVHDARRERPQTRTTVQAGPRPGAGGVPGPAGASAVRVEERARPGILCAWAEFPGLGRGDVPLPAEYLLRAGAALVDRLGGRRKQGSTGACRLVLPDVSLPDAELPDAELADAELADARLAELAADSAMLDNPGLPPIRKHAAPSLTAAAGSRGGESRAGGSRAGGSRAGGTGWPASAQKATWRVTLEVMTPLVAQHSVRGQLTLSLDYLPGSALFGVILARLNRPVGHQDLVVGDARPALVADDTVIPARPAPLTWSDPGAPRRGGHVAPVRAGVWRFLPPQACVGTHAAGRDRAVFAYLAIPPGTVLVTDIVLPADVRLGLAPGERLRLGKSRKDDYGEVKVRDVRRAPGRASRPVAAGPLRVWCVSDVLLRTESGRYDPSPGALAGELGRQFGVPGLAVPGPDGAPARPYRVVRRDSFQARWGRHRPSLPGLSAGSVVTLTADRPVSAAILTAVQRDGVGERTAEGFGQIRFDVPDVTEVTIIR